MKRIREGREEKLGQDEPFKSQKTLVFTPSQKSLEGSEKRTDSIEFVFQQDPASRGRKPTEEATVTIQVRSDRCLNQVSGKGK